MDWSTLGVLVAADLGLSAALWLAFFIWLGVKAPHYVEADLVLKGVLGWWFVLQALVVIVGAVLMIGMLT